MNKFTKKPWTERENDLLVEYYHTLSMEALYAILPGRGRAETQKQVAHLKRKNRKFATKYEH